MGYATRTLRMVLVFAVALIMVSCSDLDNLETLAALPSDSTSRASDEVSVRLQALANKYGFNGTVESEVGEDGAEYEIIDTERDSAALALPEVGGGYSYVLFVGDELLVYESDGITAAAVITPNIFDMDWELVKISGSKQHKRNKAQIKGLFGILPTLRLGSDGSVSGFLGCDDIQGTFNRFNSSKSRINLKVQRTTKNNCSPVLKDADRNLRQALKAVSIFKFKKGNILVLKGHLNGKQCILRFKKKPGSTTTTTTTSSSGSTTGTTTSGTATSTSTTGGTGTTSTSTTGDTGTTSTSGTTGTTTGTASTTSSTGGTTGTSTGTTSTTGSTDSTGSTGGTSTGTTNTTSSTGGTTSTASTGTGTTGTGTTGTASTTSGTSSSTGGTGTTGTGTTGTGTTTTTTSTTGSGTSGYTSTGGTSGGTTGSGSTTGGGPSSSLSGVVWNDANNNGIREAGETGIPNVTVTLISADGSTSVTTTDANGNYTFTNLPAGNYQVSVTRSAQTAFSPQDQGSDATDSDVDPTTGTTSTIVLGVGQHITNVDAGVYPIPQLGNIEGTIFDDDEGDSSFTGDGILPEEVVVSLTRPDGTVVTTTTVNGRYSFPDLPPGNYTVQFPSATPSGRPLTATRPTNGTNSVSVDLSANETEVVDAGYKPAIVPDPKLTVRKKVIQVNGQPATSATPVKPGDVITYEISVKNPGNVPIANIDITSPTGASDCERDSSEDASLALLQPNAVSTVYTCQVTVPAQASGEFRCRVQATGTDPQGNQVTDGKSVKNPVSFVPDPEIEIVKTAIDNTTLKPGDTARFRIDVRNVGNVDLKNAMVNSDLAACSRVIGDLAVGETESYTCEAIIPENHNQTTFPCSATVTGTTTDGTGVTDDDSDQYTVDLTPEPPNKVTCQSSDVRITDASGKVLLSRGYVILMYQLVNGRYEGMIQGSVGGQRIQVTLGDGHKEGDKVIFNDISGMVGYTIGERDHLPNRVFIITENTRADGWFFYPQQGISADIHIGSLRCY